MKPRTSRDHPLKIADLPAARGHLGLTFCPGKHQPDGMTGAWRRDLRLDLDVIRQWGAAAVVTLLEPHELAELEVPDLGARIEALGIEWYPVPLPDGSVPQDAGLARWRYSMLRARRHVESGRRVVLHCKGGLGRTGTAAARLLIDLGADPHDAIRRVRQARPGAIETAEQERWIRSEPVPSTDACARLERTLACLLGGAVGDGFGYEVEFDAWHRIHERFGDQGLQGPVYHGNRLRVSDDTQMTLFTCEGLIRATRHDRDLGSVETSVWHAYRRWLDTQQPGQAIPAERGWLVDEPALRQSRAPGNTCLSALQRDLPPADWRAVNDSKGCGGVMRVAPVGLVPELLDAARTFDVGVNLAGLTHGHATGYLASGAMALMVREMFTGTAPRAAVEVAREHVARYPEHEETVRALEAALELADRGETAPEAAFRVLGEGWIAEEALAIGVWAALTGKSFVEAIRRAANHGGDSDSTASVAGQLLGAAHGLDTLPQSWVRRLDVLDPLLVLACDLWTLDSRERDGTTLRDYPRS